MYDIKHCFICRPLDLTVSEDAGIEPRTVVTTALTVRRSNHSARSHPLNIKHLLSFDLDMCNTKRKKRKDDLKNIIIGIWWFECCTIIEYGFQRFLPFKNAVNVNGC
jgi:hypothetical protein